MDFSALILLAVICVAVAVLIGYLLATVLGSRASSSPPPQARQEGLDQLISFWSDRQMRRILPQINGKAIESPHLLKENERRQLLLLYQALRKGQSTTGSLVHRSNRLLKLSYPRWRCHQQRSRRQKRGWPIGLPNHSSQNRI